MASTTTVQPITTEVPPAFRPGTPMPAALLLQGECDAPVMPQEDRTEGSVVNSTSQSRPTTAAATSVGGSALKAAKAKRAPFKVEDTRNGSLLAYSNGQCVSIRCDQRKGADCLLPPRTDLPMGPQYDIRRAEIAEARNARVASNTFNHDRAYYREGFVLLILEAARFQQSMYRWPHRRLQIGAPAPSMTLLNSKEGALVTPWSSRSGRIRFPLQPRKDRKTYMLLTQSAVKTLISDVYILVNPSQPTDQAPNVRDQLAGLHLFQPALFPTRPRLE